ncbi:substrate-binding domain-containing protein [Chitinophaga japonensis]|uniref:LacI family transcriptional regulator n=1 Tax=Chitinophaga japonensis TaxID=104662 RepID=A0A562T764_CHIJA|nr:substrate-binding domain-containing protein [Chitinophaga japonensis]TWI89193.1 LacI family transcriptional regulator [Chitinophaga japonensis]
MKRTSLKDVAKKAGVAPSTVSLVLNGKARQRRISDALAARIESVAREVGYQPHPVAVNLRTGQSKTLGLIVESISGSFFASLARTIEAEADSYGYKVLYCSTENNPQKGKELIQMMLKQQVDGYLVTPAPGMEKDIRQLVQLGQPVVLMDSYFEAVDTPYVLVDNYKGIRTCMEHLLAKGYRDIGFVTAGLDLVQLQQREQAYRDACTQHGIPAAQQQVLTVPYDASQSAIIRRIGAFIKGRRNLEALLFATNYLGVAGVETINRLGLRIPDDLAVVCFDDHDVFRLYPPGISAFQQPIASIAKTAISLLMKQMGVVKGKPGKQQVVLEGKFIRRHSL